MNTIHKILKERNIFIFLGIFVVLFLVIFMLMPTKNYNLAKSKVSKLYFVGNISLAHQSIIDRFNEKNRGKIKVVTINLPFEKFSTNERKELLVRTLRSKSNRIDVFTVDIIWVPRFAKWCQPLDEYFSLRSRDQILGHVLRSCYYNNQLVAIPLYTDIGLMYYRKDLVGKLPDATIVEKRLKESITWEEFIELRRRFDRLQVTNPFYVYAADNFEGLMCSFFEGITSQNQTFFNGDSVCLNTPQIQKSLQLLVDLVHKYNITPPIVTKFDDYQANLYALKHDAIFFRGWPGFMRQYHTSLTKTGKLQYIEKAAIPHFRGFKPCFVYGGWNFMVSKYSSKKNEAVQFIKFALQEENQKLLFEKGGYIPINKSVYEDSLFLALHPDLKYYCQLIKNGVHRPYLVNYTKISDVISYYLHLAIKNELSVPEALKQAARYINSKKVLIE